MKSFCLAPLHSVTFRCAVKHVLTALKRLNVHFTRIVGCSRRQPELLLLLSAAAVLLRLAFCCGPAAQLIVICCYFDCSLPKPIEDELDNMDLLRRIWTVFRLLSLVVGVLVVCVRSFNIDVHAPIVKQGDADSYFGFSVAQHLVYNHGRGFGDPV